MFDRPGSEESLSGFGVPERFVDPLVCVPFAELTAAAGLLPAHTSVWGAWAAFALFSLFTVVIAFNLQRGNEVDCHCFGSLHSGTIGWPTLARNIALVALSVFLISQSRLSAELSLVHWLDGLTTGEHIIFWVELGAFAAAGVVIHFTLDLQKRLGALTDKLDKLSKNKTENKKKEEEAAAPSKRPDVFSPARGLPIGAPAPDFSLRSLDEEELTLGSLLAGGSSALLMFVDPGCPPCDALLPSLEEWDRNHSDKIKIALISSGTSEDDAYAFASSQIRHVVDNGSSVHKAYAANWTPSAVLVSPQGMVSSRLANGSEAVEQLVRHAVGNDKRPWLGMKVDTGKSSARVPASPGPKFGDPAPQFSLRDIDGKRVRLSDFLGKKVLLLFWSAGCSFCSGMADDIRNFEQSAPEKAPQLLLIARGSARANKRLGFQSPILIVRNSGIAEQFGVFGTPSGIMVDENGSIASSVETVASNVMALLGVPAINSTT